MSAHTRQSQTKTIERLTVLFCNAVELVRGGKRSEEMVELLLDKLQRFKQNELKNETSAGLVVCKDPVSENSRPRIHVDDLVIAKPDKANDGIVQEEAKSPRRTIMNCEQFKTLLSEHERGLMYNPDLRSIRKKMLRHCEDCEECEFFFDRLRAQYEDETKEDDEQEMSPSPISVATKLDQVNDALRIRVVKTDGSGNVDTEKTNVLRKKVLEDLKLKPIQRFGRAEHFRHVSADDDGLLTIKYEAFPSKELDVIHDEELAREQQKIARRIAEREAKFMEGRKHKERHFCVRCGKEMHRPSDVSLVTWGYTRKCEDCLGKKRDAWRYCITCGKKYHKNDLPADAGGNQLNCNGCAV